MKDMFSPKIKQIELHNEKIEYTLKVSKRARMMRLAVYRGGDFIVTAPRSVGEDVIERFIIEKSQWVIDKINYLKQFPAGTLIKSNRGDFLKHKKAALELAEKRIEYFNGFYKFKFNKINIRDQRTRWGSCSKKSNLNFNYKIMLLPRQLADYIIVHELCHLGEFNHSKKFWNLVAKAIPNYQGMRNELKKNRISL